MTRPLTTSETIATELGKGMRAGSDLLATSTPAGVENAVKSLAILAGRLRFLGGPCWLEDARERGLLP